MFTKRTGLSRGVSLIVVSLNVCIGKGLVQARNNRFNVEIAGLSIWENVSRSNLDRLLEKIMFQNNKASLQGTCISDDIFPVVQNIPHGSAI